MFGPKQRGRIDHPLGIGQVTITHEYRGHATLGNHHVEI